VSQRKILELTAPNNPLLKARVVKDSDTGEYIVKLYKAGKHYAPADYFTNDKADANYTAHAMLSHKNPARGPRGEVDGETARELFMYGVNDGALYRQRAIPIIANLRKKIAKGTYDPVLALKLWKYWADDAMQRYFKEFGKFTVNVPTRLEAARLAQQHYEDRLRRPNPRKRASKRVPGLGPLAHAVGYGHGKRLLGKGRKRRATRKNPEFGRSLRRPHYVIAYRGKSLYYLTRSPSLNTNKAKARPIASAASAEQLAEHWARIFPRMRWGVEYP